jgi:putrescine---pyruvate transaminase
MTEATNARPNEDIAELRRLDIAHHLPAQADWQVIEDLGGSRIITRAEGCFVWDGDGNRLLDGMAGLWCVAVGYGRKELADAAHEQMLQLPFYNTFFKTATPPPIRLAAKIAEKLGGELQHIFFNNSGSEANDTVFRLVRHYWTVKGQPERSVFIGRRNGYHGSTVAGASLGGMSAMHKQGDLPIPGIVHIDQPYWYGEGGDWNEAEFGVSCARLLEEKILDVGADKVAAFIAEPVQGAGGVIIPPATYWPEIERICRKYGVLLVADEVICGFGRLGAWFGHQRFGFTPDIVSMAKGLSSGYLPISATAVSSDIVATLKTGGEFVHGFTYSGHPVCAAVALANLEIIERESLVDRVRDDIGPYFEVALAGLSSHPLVGQVRSMGLIGAVEIVADKATRERFGGKEGTAGPAVRDQCIARGLMVRAVRDTIVMSPPLIITREEVDLLVSTLRTGLDAAMPSLLTTPKAA